MPVYEYRCSQCQRTFEYQQRMADPAKTTCEECGGSLERLISRSNFALKGGGWYKDLYASTKPEAASGTGSDSAATSTTSTTKPDAPAAAAPAAAAPAAAPSTPSGGSGTGGGTGSSGTST